MNADSRCAVIVQLDAPIHRPGREDLVTDAIDDYRPAAQGVYRSQHHVAGTPTKVASSTPIMMTTRKFPSSALARG